MSTVRLRLQDIPTAEKLTLARSILAKIQGNPSFPDAQKLLGALTSEIDALEAAEIKALGSRKQATADTSARDAQEATLDKSLRGLADAVEKESKGDAALIQSAGLEVAAEKSPIGSLSAPQHLSVTQGDEDGELSATCDPVRGARSYLWEVTEDAAGKTGWRVAGVGTRSSHDLKGLTSGTRYFVRVAAVGAAGQSPFGDALAKVAP
jgi:hypothetical protein